MSAEAVGWVFRHSTATGAAFQVHLAIADSTNDQNDYELWMRVPTLARKARCNAGTVRRAIADLIAAGLLAELDDGRSREDAGSATRPRRFRLLMPDDAEIIYESRLAQRARVPASTARGPASDARGTRAHSASDLEPKEGTQPEPKENAAPALFAGGTVAPTPTPRSGTMDEISGEQPAFAQWWLTYPKKADKGAARKAWPKAMRAVGGDARVLIAAAERYRDDPNREDAFTKNPATWLNAEAWRNGPLPARQGRAQVSSALSGLAAMAAGGASSRELDQ